MLVVSDPDPDPQQIRIDLDPQDPDPSLGKIFCDLGKTVCCFSSLKCPLYIC